MKGKTQLFSCNFQVYCDTFNCSKPAKWFVGKPDGPLNCTFRLCQSCAESLLTIVPDGLKTNQEKSDAKTQTPTDVKPKPRTRKRVAAK